ncbi:unnamed protein product, partial [Closterium sp. NIES-54]
MATPSVLTFDAEGRAVDFEVWVDDLQLFLQCDRADGLSLFDLTSGASPAPPATADSTVRSQWATRDAAARLAVRHHLPTTERAHFSQYKSAQTLYDAVVARYSSPATAALSRLMLPYLFPDLAAFPTVADLITHLCTSDTRYCAALHAELCAKNPPPMYITLYYIVTRLPDSLRLVRDHFLSVCPTTLTVDLLEERLLAAETSIVAVGACRGDPRTPVFEGCSPSPLLPFVASAAVADLGGFESLRRWRQWRRWGWRWKWWRGWRCRWQQWRRRRRRRWRREQRERRWRRRRRRRRWRRRRRQRWSWSEEWVRWWSAPAAAAQSCDPVPSGASAGVAIFDLDYDAILAAMYAVSYSAEGDCYLCVPPDPGIEAAALGTGEAAALGASASAAPGAGESALSGTASAQAFHTFTLDSGASRSFFRDRTTLTPLSRPVAVSLADPSGGPVLASFSTVLPIRFTHAGQRVTHCTCARTGRHLATFTHRPGSSLYTLTAASPPVAESGQVAASSQVFAAASRSGPESAPCLCRLLSHQTLLWHHRLGHPSLPQAPLQTLHMDVWGPARVRGQGHERYFLLVVDDSLRYTTVFPLRSKGDVTEVLIDWIRVARLQLRERFGSDFPVLLLHFDRGGEFSSARLGAFCRAQGIRQTFTLPASPQQNGIAERRIGMVMDVARTSMIHAAAPHFLWPFAVQYATHQLNLQARVSLPETSPTLRWTGKVDDASAFRVRGSRAFVRDWSADKLSPRAVPCVFLGFPPDAPGWQFYHPTSRRVLSSKDVTFDESVPYYRLFPYRTAPPPPPPLFLAPGPPPVDPLPPPGPAPSGVSQVDAVEPVEVAVDSVAARGTEPAGSRSGGAEPEGAEPGGAESRGAEPGGAEPRGAEPGGAECGGPESGGAEPGGAESRGAGTGGAEPGGAERGGAGSTRVASRGTLSRRELLSPQELREWFAWRWSRAPGAGGTTVAAGSGGTRTGGTGAAEAAGVGLAGGTAGATDGTGAAGPAGTGAAGATGAGAAGGVGAGGSAGAGTSEGAGVGAVGARGHAGAGAAAGGTGAVPAGSRGATRPRPYSIPLLEQVLDLPPSTGSAPPLACPQPIPSQSQLQPASPLPAPSPYTGPTGGLAEHQSSLPVLADPESDSFRAVSPTITRFLAIVVTDPSSESTAASALVAELVDFAAHCRLDNATSLVAESASVCPPSVGDPDAPDIPTPRSYAEAIEGPYSSQWQSAMDAEMASWKSTGTYVDEVPPPGANIVTGMWIFRVKRPPGSPPVFKARYVARGFSQQQGVDYFQTFSPTPKMTTLRVLLHVAAQRDYELHSLDFSTAFLQGSLHEEIWLRRPPGFTGSFPP